MPVVWLRIAAINGFLAVAGGALAAHALKSTLTAEQLATFETGVRYQMYHALTLLGVALLARHSRALAVSLAGWCFTLGIVLFSGSLYLLAFTDQAWVGAVTPFGGACLLLGWLALATIALRPRPRIRF